ncbi:hypothetical protein CEXT_576611 [Caerostris extrusa]|uniref:Uncharacterized protein n=1 Tax=Caerostris extrusa TaxID=172846 RepID=A0AAV4WMP1_CAEEX|nr:hypothetical protein CEXT_576611 [Caerostris extrusa]
MRLSKLLSCFCLVEILKKVPDESQPAWFRVQTPDCMISSESKAGRSDIVKQPNALVFQTHVNYRYGQLITLMLLYTPPTALRTLLHQQLHQQLVAFPVYGGFGLCSGLRSRAMTGRLKNELRSHISIRSGWTQLPNAYAWWAGSRPRWFQPSVSHA